LSERIVGTVRESAVRILSGVEKNLAHSDLLLDAKLNQGGLGSKDRALLTELVYGSLRWQGRIDWILSRFLTQPPSSLALPLKIVLRLALYQLLFLSRIPEYALVHESVAIAKKLGGQKAGGFVNAVLRRAIREKDSVRWPDREKDLPSYLSVYGSHPLWLVKKWLSWIGPEGTEALLHANNQESPVVLRVNRLKTSRDELIRKIREQGVEAEPSRWSPLGIQLKNSSSVESVPGFAGGLFQVQAESSQLIGYLLQPKPGEKILDACAAPGGKATAIAELMNDQGQVIIIDISRRGLEKLRQNMRRLGLKSIEPVLADMTGELQKKSKHPYDRVLVDAPCTGLGTLRSHPEIKWHREEKDVSRLSKLQGEILKKAALMVKDKGVLVYATCTLTHEENRQVVESFLRDHQDFALEPVAEFLPGEAEALSSGPYFTALPHEHGTDGFFAARMRKVD